MNSTSICNVFSHRHLQLRNTEPHVKKLYIFAPKFLHHKTNQFQWLKILYSFKSGNCLNPMFKKSNRKTVKNILNYFTRNPNSANISKTKIKSPSSQITWVYTLIKDNFKKIEWLISLINSSFSITGNLERYLTIRPQGRMDYK